MSDKLESRFYVTLDTLLDTRFAVLSEICEPGQLNDVMINGYFSRVVDEFHGVDTARFSEAYLNRDKKTLKHALLTNIYRQLLTFINRTIEARVATPYITTPLVVLNTFPFKLTESETNTIILALSGVLENKADITVIYEDYLTVTPSSAKESYVAMFMYDYWRWMDAQAENGEFEKAQCSSVFLLGPAIFKSKEAIQSVKNLDARRAIEEYASPFVRLTLLDSSEFSVTLSRLKQLKTVMKG